MRIAAFFMARSLQSGSDVVEETGARLKVDARKFWQPDDAFFDLVRDRATVNALLADVAGDAAAKANVAEKAKTQKQIIRDCLAGASGRTKVEGWLPGWLAFPARGIGQGPLPVAQPLAEIELERMAAE
jgi:ParB family chromosome partitioning protein